MRQPMRVAGRGLRAADDEQWGAAARAVDFFDVKGDVEGAGRAARRALRAGAHPALHPGRSARVLIDGPPSAGSANCTRAGCRSTTCRRRRSLFELDAAAAAGGRTSRVPRGAPASRRCVATSPWSSRSSAAGAGRSGRHSGATNRPRALEPCLFDYYRGRASTNGQKKPCVPGSYARYSNVP